MAERGKSRRDTEDHLATNLVWVCGRFTVRVFESNARPTARRYLSNAGPKAGCIGRELNAFFRLCI
jgi:hypothetical protein